MTREEWLTLCHKESARCSMQADAMGFQTAAQRIRESEELKTECFRAVADAAPWFTAAKKAEEEASHRSQTAAESDDRRSHYLLVLFPTQMRIVEEAKEWDGHNAELERQQMESDQQLLEDGGWHELSRQAQETRDLSTQSPPWASQFNAFEAADRETFASGSFQAVPNNLPLPISQFGEQVYSPPLRTSSSMVVQRPRVLSDYN